MIVAREETSQIHMSTGIWGRVTLDQILERNAATRPTRIAVADFSDRSEWSVGRPRQLTYAELDQRIETLAAFFAGLGLAADSVVAVQMPATVDAVVVHFAAMRAGLVVAPMPLAWREAEVIEALAQIGAKAIVTVAETKGEGHGERLRGVASELFHIRFVFAAGGQVPDGLIDLDQMFEEHAAVGSAPNMIRKGNAADHAASIAWVTPVEGGPAIPLARSHNHWIAIGLMTLLEAKIDNASVIVSPIGLSSLIGFGGGLMPWLLACGTLVLGLPESVDRIAETVVEFDATHVLVPQRFARRLSERLEMHRRSPMLLIAAADRPIDAHMPRGHEIVDLTAIGEYGLIARRRLDPGEARPLPIGIVGSPSDTDFAPALIESRIKALPQRASDIARGAAAIGELQVRGPMVPELAWGLNGRPVALDAGSDDWVSTGLSVHVISADPPAFEVRGPIGDVTGRGAMGFDLRQLDTVFQSVEGVADAAAVPYPDPTSVRIAAVVVPEAGTPFDEAAYRAAIEARRVGVHKLPVEVFTVPAIARGANDRVLRTGMASRLAATRTPDVGE